MTRYETFVEDGTVYVGHEERLEIGPVEDIVDVVGGPAWTIQYTEAEKRRHPGMDTSDEGLTVDVVDMLQTMTHGERFVETLAAHPAEIPSDDPDAIAPRTGLFVGKLLENLENGLD
ncbi:hypothetical protein [Halapricum desulfuricans]|uniref:Uncharacterized protein n=1 Tax=Halapricum desulfuricans TaxID=2841257 RepID=A0A897ND28_9EURY|nr:hypothetical protein [Halapricum desulfuricans]QSG09345.1 Uncharacterized protein HSR122_1960 [Halapricum desulfuricans]QSG12255.1 Uncharacterized protein HSBGL_1844 [Halapricum desulfuricans]